MTDWSDDDELMAVLAEAVAEADAVTDRRREAAQAAFTWRHVDAELMELLHDSALEAGAAVRGAGDPGRLLSFGRGELIDRGRGRRGRGDRSGAAGAGRHA